MADMTIFDWERTAEFRSLSEQQQFFVRSYVESQEDRVFAAQSAYSIADKEVARIKSYKCLDSEKVRRALYRFHGVDPDLAILKERVLAAADDPNVTQAQVDALRLALALHGVNVEGTKTCRTRRTKRTKKIKTV